MLISTKEWMKSHPRVASRILLFECIAIALAFVWNVYHLWNSILPWIEDHPGLASWVQAVGTVIPVGLLVYSSKADKKRQLEQEENQVKLAYQVIDQAITASVKALEFAYLLRAQGEGNPDERLPSYMAFNMFEKRLSEIQIKNPAHADAIGLMANIQICLIGFSGAVEQLEKFSRVSKLDLMKYLEPSPGIVDYMEERVMVMKANLAIARGSWTEQDAELVRKG